LHVRCIRSGAPNASDGLKAEAYEAELHARRVSNGLKPSDLDADLAIFDKSS
jgi:hypothetical protein